MQVLRREKLKSVNASMRVVAALESSSEDEASKTLRTKNPSGFPWGLPWSTAGPSEQSEKGNRDHQDIQPEDSDQMKSTFAEKEKIIEQQTVVITKQNQELEALQRKGNRDHHDIQPEDIDQMKSASAEKEKIIEEQTAVIEKQSQQLQMLQQDVQRRDEALKTLLSNSADNSGVKLLQDENVKLKKLLENERDRSLQLQNEELKAAQQDALEGNLLKKSPEKSGLEDMKQVKLSFVFQICGIVWLYVHMNCRILARCCR